MNKIKPAGLYLSLSGLLKDLIADGFLSQADANSLAAAQRGQDEALLHPLQIIAARQYSHPQTDSPLTLQVLSQWLADKAELPLAHIDPLK
ncbi:MAG: type II/IV secretion system protein, partial [Porticoccaceae bacterium]